MQNNSPTFPDIDDQRVNVIRTQLDEDAYVVNTRQIADKIIDIELALTNPAKLPSERHIS
jgi:anti-sigma28 factor (negative regulator of flagellin synthesis)